MKKNIEKAWCMLKKHEVAAGLTLLLTLLYFMGVAIWVLERASVQRHQSVVLHEVFEKILLQNGATEKTISEGRELVRQDDTRLIDKWFDEAIKSL